MPECISIIIPTFNRATIVGNTIQSVLNQSSPRWELILVDDGSTDDTATAIEPFLKDERIKFMEQEHAGVSIARNNGARLATGSHLIFLDSDDRLHQDLVQVLHKNQFWKYDLIFWNMIKRTGEKNVIWKPRNLGKMYNNVKGSFLPASVCYNKEVFFKAGQYDSNLTFGENYELGMRICSIENLKIKQLNKTLHTQILKEEDRYKKYPFRLESHLYQYRKHKDKYLAHPIAHAEILRIIGYNFERAGTYSRAIKFYYSSWLRHPWQVKPLLKILYLKFIK